MSASTAAGWRPGFGRNVEHDDPRSFSFPAPRLGDPRGAATVHDVTWPHHGGVLDQDGVGACTAFALGDLLHAAPMYRAAWARPVDRAWCFAAYALETTLDPFAGAWVFDGIVDGQPTGHGDDTGSSSLGMYRAGKHLGVVSRVEWAFGRDHALAALMVRPGAVGIPWRADMMTPDSSGRIRYSGAVEGGHEVGVYRVRVASERVYIFNHWLMPDGSPWGQRGWAWLTWDDFGQALAEQGDFAQFYAPWEGSVVAG